MSVVLPQLSDRPVRRSRFAAGTRRFAAEVQQKVIEARRQAPSLGYLVLVEHDPPVITISRRKTARDHLLATDEQLASAGVQLTQTDRGGDITFCCNPFCSWNASA